MSIAQNLPNRALIGGKWVEGSAGTFEVRSPHTGEVFNEMAKCDTGDVDRAVAAARAAQPAWASLALVERVERLRRVTDIFGERCEDVARTITSEIGKTIIETREEVYEYSAPAYRRAGEEILRHRGLSFPSTQERTSNKRLVMGHRPLGVVAVVAPYNFPTDISSIAISHIIAAGNTVVWKPSEYVPTACSMVAEIFAEAGVPDGVVNVVHGFGDVGAALVEHDDVDGIYFTGSTATGRKIADVAGLKPRLLELGGNGPMIVLADADVDAAVDGAMVGCFHLAGQVCTSAERLFVHERVHDEFVEKLAARVATLRIGDPHDEATDMGPLCNSTTLNRVIDHVEDARSKGAGITQVGPKEGMYYPATVLTGVTTEMLIMQEETFGPVAPVLKIASPEDAVEIANRSRGGLTAAVYTQSLADAWRVSEALPHGTVCINETTNYWDQLAPFGGTGNSGVGRELSQWFLDTFTETKLLVFDLGEEPHHDRRAEGGW